MKYFLLISVFFLSGCGTLSDTISKSLDLTLIPVKKVLNLQQALEPDNAMRIAYQTQIVQIPLPDNPEEYEVHISAKTRHQGKITETTLMIKDTFEFGSRLDTPPQGPEIVPTPIPVESPQDRFILWLQTELGANESEYQRDVTLEGILVDVYFPQTKTAVLFNADRYDDLVLAGYTVHVLYQNYLTQIFDHYPEGVYGYWLDLFRKALDK